MKFGDVVLIETPYRPPSGSFARPKNVKNNRHSVGPWHNCRDIFNRQLFNLDLFFYATDVGQARHVAHFLNKIEEMLNIEPRSEFGPTQRKCIMWIRPSKWWTYRVMRRSLFTILLRAGREYLVAQDNFEHVIKSEKYLDNTRYAFDRFLSGHTHYTGKNRGWYKQFYEYNLSKDEIDKLLIKK